MAHELRLDIVTFLSLLKALGQEMSDESRAAA